MSQPEISDLPDEILENIFKNFNYYYGSEAIKNLTEVCSRFNDIISGNKELTKFLSVIWNGEKEKNIDVLLGSKRKYQNIVLSYVKQIDENLIKFLKKNPIADLISHGATITVSDLAKLLKAVANNVQNLKIRYMYLTEADKEEIEDLVDFPKLEKLCLYEISSKEMSPIFTLFKNAANVKKFNYTDHRYLDVNETSQLSRMLASFTELEILKLETYEPYFYADDFLASNAKFSLKKYSHSRPDEASSDEEYDPTDYDVDDFINEFPHFLKFLKSQQASLEFLKVFRFPITSEIIDSILAMDKLENLSLFECTFRSTKTTSVKNTSIKTLEIGHSMIDDDEYRAGDLNRDTEVGFTAILSNCLNVKDLKVYDIEITSGLSMCISIHMKNLESISFLSIPRIFPMTYSSVKEMNFSFGFNMNYDDVLNLIQANQQLKILHLQAKIQEHPNYAATMALLNLEKLKFYSQY